MPTFYQAKYDLHYPDSDGKSMADNTEQYRWIVIIKENLEILFADIPDVFIAGDLLWYPVPCYNKNVNLPNKWQTICDRLALTPITCLDIYSKGATHCEGIFWEEGFFPKMPPLTEDDYYTNSLISP